MCRCSLLTSTLSEYIGANLNIGNNNGRFDQRFPSRLTWPFATASPHRVINSRFDVSHPAATVEASLNCAERARSAACTILAKRVGWLRLEGAPSSRAASPAWFSTYHHAAAGCCCCLLPGGAPLVRQTGPCNTRQQERGPCEQLGEQTVASPARTGGFVMSPHFVSAGPYGAKFDRSERQRGPRSSV